jgi:membrane fusion protein (multidrug efflux system)
MTKPKNVNKKTIFIGVAVVAVLVAAYFVVEHMLYVTTDNAQVDAHVVMLAPKVGGYIRAVNVREGDKVKKDQVLIEVDARDYKNAADEIRAQLDSIKAKKEELESNYKRISSLYTKNVVSRQQYDTANSAYAEIKARFDGMSAQLAQAELNLENTEIKAPKDGFIARRSVEVGQLASPGVPLLGFVEGGERWITANFKETDLDDIRVGAKASVAVDALPGLSFKAEVESISASTGATFALLPPDNATGNFTKVVQRVPVRLKLLGLSEKDVDDLRAGLSAVVSVNRR